MSLCLKLQEPQIMQENIWAEDKLERKEIAERYTNLLDSITQSFVITINSPFGTGKSFFLKRWYYSLSTERYAALFFNAWQTDFYEHAFVPFLCSVYEQIKEKQLIGEDSTLYSRFQSIAEKLISSVSMNLIELGTAGIIKKEDLEGTIRSSKEFHNQDYFQAYKERQKVLEEFKEILTEIVTELKVKDQKLVIFIDELERCRPTYAVELLESIKHLFDVDGVIFVLATDKAQLQHTVSTLYGAAMDAEGYLRRFIDLELSLPNPTRNQYIKYLYDNHRLNEVLKFEDSTLFGGRTLVNYMLLCSKIFNLTLRELAQCFTELNITIRTLGKEKVFFPILLSFLVCLKVKHRDLYNSLRPGIDIDATLNAFDAILMSSNITSDEKNAVRSYYIFGLDNNDTKQELRNLA